jgi:hypothetical protein
VIPPRPQSVIHSNHRDRRQRRLVIAGAAALTLLIAACGDGDSAAPSAVSTVPSEVSTVPSEVATTQSLATCDGLADRWVEIQQMFLDDLGDAPVADGTSSPQVIDAGRRMGLLLLEYGRDIERAGCDVELAPGSPPLCARLDRLTPMGPAGQDVVDGLGADCP